MAEQFPFLLSPIQLGNVTVKNRVVFLPHLTLYADGELPSETHAYYFGERAKGGTGLVVMECQGVHPRGRMGVNCVAAWKKESIPGLKKIADKVHENGGKIFAQITHGGNTTTEWAPQLLWGPSEIPDPVCGVITKPMTKDEIKEVVEHFAISAQNEMAAGMDGIELKVAHDGLLRTFLSTYTNKREDEYGGSRENRMRIVMEVIDAVRQAIGPDAPLGMRLCLDEFFPGGYSLDESVEFAKAFAQTGKLTYISTDAGTFASLHFLIPPMTIPLGFATYMSAALKEVIDIPVIAFGRINDPVQAEKILAEGLADMIGMARQLICDPEFVNKAKEGRVDDIRNCVACNDGCIYRCLKEKPIHCVQNPAAGREKELGIGTLQPAAIKKNIMVVGGGPSGLKLAEIAARRGHKVSLYEKENELGGQINVATKAANRDELGGVVRWLKGQVEKLGVDIHMGTEVTPQLVDQVKPDVVVVATGAVPQRASFPGADQDNVVLVQDVLNGSKEVGQNVVIVDNDNYWGGTSTAETLLDQGKNVQILTGSFFVGSDLEFGNLFHYYSRIMEKGAQMSSLTAVKEVSGNTVTVGNPFGGADRKIEGVDTVVVATRAKSVTDLYESIKGKAKQVVLLGDAVAPRKMMEDIFEAEMIGREL
ncbi:MAG: FAD-dependent oxidoreductase [Chloroflexi bacterium]|nr:FAD-dependent oxidoreductase [Chloroflexota bacterium]